jgi:hypothetical protein
MTLSLVLVLALLDDAEDDDQNFFWLRSQFLAAYYLFFVRQDPVPCYTSILTGELHFNELMATPHMPRFRSAVRMDKETFARLLSLPSGPRGRLRSTKNICLGEKVMSCMSLLCGCSNRMLAERWQHSPLTISAVIHEVLGIVTSNAVTKFFMVKYNTREVQPQILQNKKFSPFFDNCIGAIDGTHIPVVAPENEQLAFHN